MSTPSSVRTAWKTLGHFYLGRWQPLSNNPDFKSHWEAIDYIAYVVWSKSWMDEHDARMANVDPTLTTNRAVVKGWITSFMIDDAIAYIHQLENRPRRKP